MKPSRYDFDTFSVWVIEDGVLSRLQQGEDVLGEDTPEFPPGCDRQDKKSHKVRVDYPLRKGEIIKVREGPSQGNMGIVKEVTGGFVKLTTQEGKTITTDARWVTREF